MFASGALGPQSLEGELEMHGDGGGKGLRPVGFSALGFRERKRGGGGNERKNFNQQMPAGQQ